MRSPYKNIGRLNLIKIQTNLELVVALSCKAVIRPVHGFTLHFVCTKHRYKINGEIMHTIEIPINIVNDVMSHEVLTSALTIYLEDRSKNT